MLQRWVLKTALVRAERSGTSGTPRQLTNAAKSSNLPVWSPDGRLLAFASDQEGKRQIYLIDPSGGAAEKLTSSDEGVGGFDWAPDGASTTSGRPRRGAAFWTAIGAGAGVAAALIANAANPACDKPDNMCSANVVVFGGIGAFMGFLVGLGR